MEEVDEYDATLVWAEQEEKLRLTRGQGISSFYLIIGSIFILLICIFILYYSNRGRKDEITTLDMMRDPENIYDEEFSSYEVEEELEQQELPNNSKEVVENVEDEEV